MISLSDLPSLNAILNSTSALLLITGYILIRRGRRTAHKACMLSALGVSMLFLITYLTYHAQVGYTRFEGEGWIRAVYFFILIPHTVLAAVAVVPLAVVTVYLALKGRLGKHRSIARWTLPIWLFVSVTGVLVYLMLYHLV